MPRTKKKKQYGKVAGVPYDFRKPTKKMVKDRMWNEKDVVFTPKVMGIGWTLNFRNPKSYLVLAAIAVFVLGSFYFAGLI